MIQLYCLICGEQHEASDKNDVCCGDICRNALYQLTKRGVETELDEEDARIVGERIDRVTGGGDSGLVGTTD